MTDRSIVAYLFSFVFFLLQVQDGNSQGTLAVSKRKLSIHKIEELIDLGQFEQAKSEIEVLLVSPQINGVIAASELEYLQSMQI
ncbi:MAG: hypothetical protein RL253_698, partial [Bacteroidota bacterium]